MTTILQNDTQRPATPELPWGSCYREAQVIEPSGAVIIPKYTHKTTKYDPLPFGTVIQIKACHGRLVASSIKGNMIWLHREHLKMIAHGSNPFINSSLATAFKDKLQIAETIANIHALPNGESHITSVALFGQKVIRIGHYKDKNWIEVQTADGHQGAIEVSQLERHNISEMTHSYRAVVKTLEGKVFKSKDRTLPAVYTLYFGTYISLEEDFEKEQEPFVAIITPEGKRYWMQRGDLESPSIKSPNEIAQIAKRFLGKPNISGGASSEGCDNSGFIQMLMKMGGRLLPRNVTAQNSSAMLMRTSDSKIGDLLYFRNRKGQLSTAIVSKKSQLQEMVTFIHSDNNPHSPIIHTSYSVREQFPICSRQRVRPIAFKGMISKIDKHTREVLTHQNPKLRESEIDSLALLQFHYWNFDTVIGNGELLLHKSIAKAAMKALETLFRGRHPIEKALLGIEYDGDLHYSAFDNNTSATTHFSITINPVLNPTSVDGDAYPDNGAPYLRRNYNSRGMIKENGPYHKAFTDAGFKWGGGTHPDPNYGLFCKSSRIKNGKK